MSLLTIAVPAYNAQAYLANCLDSLTPFAKDLDIIVINDGSTDDTSAIAHDYANRFPGSIRVIDKANGGHGSGINAALTEASAPWFKVVDSDDHLNGDALRAVLKELAHYRANEIPCDLLFTNYVCEVHRADDSVTHTPVRFDNVFAERTLLTWEALGRLKFKQLLQMHTLIYRTALLRELPLVLPEKTFYEDNIYAFKPLPAVQTFSYLNVDLYRYYIGRPDQSVNMANICKNAHMTVNITREMMTAYHIEALNVPRQLKRYMVRHLTRMASMCRLSEAISNNPDLTRQVKDLEAACKTFDPQLYKKIYHHPMLIGQKALALLGHKINNRFYLALGKAFSYS